MNIHVDGRTRLGRHIKTTKFTILAIVVMLPVWSPVALAASPLVFAFWHAPIIALGLGPGMIPFISTLAVLSAIK